MSDKLGNMTKDEAMALVIAGMISRGIDEKTRALVMSKVDDVTLPNVPGAHIARKHVLAIRDKHG